MKSLIALTWHNTRYIATRIARLAGTDEIPREVAAAARAGPTDEFDRIERVVHATGSALTASSRSARGPTLPRRRDCTRRPVLAGVVRDSMSQLDEVRLPLHILLESRFGELNENQEELLRDARSAADRLDVGLRRLAQVADADRDALPLTVELVQVNDVVRAVLPLARAAAERNRARLESALEPGLPRVLGDRAKLAEALALLIDEAAVQSSEQRPLEIYTSRPEGVVTLRVGPMMAVDDEGPNAGSSPPHGPTLLANRLLTCQGAAIERAGDWVIVRLSPGRR
ncbi:MAG: hypothetical protein U0163_04000 [Gemmatimonadaceae bacterium]